MPELPPDCVVVDRIEDVPEGSTWIPSHGGLDDPEAIRRFWCLDMPGDPPPVGEVPAECLRFFAAEFGGRYAAALVPPERPRSTPLFAGEDGVLLDLPGVTVERTSEGITLRMPALDLPAVP
jgi:hypothetical protein